MTNHDSKSYAIELGFAKNGDLVRRKPREEMTDAEFIKSLDEIKTPLEALWTLSTNQMYIGNDPYYRELDNALWSMAERVLLAEEVAGRLQKEKP